MPQYSFPNQSSLILYFCLGHHIGDSHVLDQHILHRNCQLLMRIVQGVLYVATYLVCGVIHNTHEVRGAFKVICLLGYQPVVVRIILVRYACRCNHSWFWVVGYKLQCRPEVLGQYACAWSCVYLEVWPDTYSWYQCTCILLSLRWWYKQFLLITHMDYWLDFLQQ